jgi:hypothetical protein
LIPSHWNIGLCISKTTKQANDWFEGKKSPKLNKKQTGKVGLEGLYKALNYINDFGELLSKNEILWIEVEDKKRIKTYNRLLRYSGWQSFDTDDGKVFMYSNPKHWRVFEGGREEI